MRGLSILAALFLLAAPAPASAQPYCWEQTPTRVPTGPYPRRTDAPDGVVRLECFINQDRTLACRVAEEEPEGWGYADLALRLMRDYRVCAGVQYPQPMLITVPFVHAENGETASR